MTRAKRAVEIVVRIDDKTEARLVAAADEVVHRSNPRPPVDSAIRSSVGHVEITCVGDEETLGLQEATGDVACRHQASLCPDDSLCEVGRVTIHGVVRIDEDDCRRGCIRGVVRKGDGIRVP